jgi:hypothetical protein
VAYNLATSRGVVALPCKDLEALDNRSLKCGCRPDLEATTTGPSMKCGRYDMGMTKTCHDLLDKGPWVGERHRRFFPSFVARCRVFNLATACKARPPTVAGGGEIGIIAPIAAETIEACRGITSPLARPAPPFGALWFVLCPGIDAAEGQR